MTRTENWLIRTLCGLWFVFSVHGPHLKWTWHNMADFWGAICPTMKDLEFLWCAWGVPSILVDFLQIWASEKEPVFAAFFVKTEQRSRRVFFSFLPCLGLCDSWIWFGPKSRAWMGSAPSDIGPNYEMIARNHFNIMTAVFDRVFFDLYTVYTVSLDTFESFESSKSISRTLLFVR